MYVLEQATNFKAGLRLGNSGNVSIDERRDILVDELFAVTQIFPCLQFACRIIIGHFWRQDFM
jgi:hypothetical protein